MNTLSSGSSRLVSLDALRGFDMFWIMGGNLIVIEWARLTQAPWLNWLAEQMHHVEWHGFHFYDIIFPLFIFLSGVSMPFSFDKRMQSGKKQLYLHIFKRTLILIFFGLITRGLLWIPWQELRHQMGYTSVLGRIALAWCLASFIYLHSTHRQRWIWFGVILAGYWMMMALIPVPGCGAGNFTHDGNLAGYLDRLLLPGKLNEGNFDSEGLLSTLPAVATALLGSFAGHLIKNNSSLTPFQKGIVLLGAGAVCMLAGWIWNFTFPINKKLWTSSFVLYAGGLSLILLSVFYLIIDVWHFKKWAFPFVIIGMNSITIYMVQRGIIQFTSMRDFFLMGFIRSMPEAWQPLLNAVGFSLAAWVFLYFLYKKNIFLKV